MLARLIPYIPILPLVYAIAWFALYHPAVSYEAIFWGFTTLVGAVISLTTWYLIKYRDHAPLSIAASISAIIYLIILFQILLIAMTPP